MKLLKFATILLIAFCFVLLNKNAHSQELWGTTALGGEDNVGVVFKTDDSGLNLVAVKEFEKPPYINASKPMFTKMFLYNEKFYGTTSQGGDYGNGVLFEYDPFTNSYTNLYEFIPADLNGDDMASHPHSGVVEYDGELYGTARFGTPNRPGALYKYNFEDGYQEVAEILAPINSPVVLNNRLYGTSHVGGVNEEGYMYEYNPETKNMVPVVQFDSSTNGVQPRGSLLVLNDKIYGMTLRGGEYNQGVIYEYDPATDDCSKIFDFDGNNGAHPFGGLIESDGVLYGMTTFGGDNVSNSNVISGDEFMPGNSGVLFEFNLSTNILTKKFDFGGLNGAHPYGDLIEFDGKLIGVTAFGGITDHGVLFEFDLTTSTFTKKVDLNDVAKGNNPMGTLAEWEGMLYGMTRYGGATRDGSLFEYEPTNGDFSKKLDFNNTFRYAKPNAGFLEFKGKLYGMTPYDGDWTSGMIYTIDPVTDEFTKIYSFDGINGQWPWGTLMEYNGKLYGLASRGGLTDNGVLFEFDPVTGVLDKKIDFNGENGHSPSNGHLVELNGKLYGLAPMGGLNGKGTLFEYDPDTEILIKKFDFGGTNGEFPWGGLIVLDDKLYGVTSGGGLIDPGPAHGVLFEYDPLDDNFTKMFEWHGLDGSTPRGSLLELQGKLYGLTSSGGVDPTPTGAGVLFEFNPGVSIEEAYHIKANFNDYGGANGANLRGSLMELCGNFYGISGAGGANGLGTFFEFDPLSEDFTRVISFDGTNGALPMSVTLVGFGSADVALVSASLDPVPVNTDVDLSVTIEDIDYMVENVIIDWGDGIETIEDLTGSTFYPTHTYTSTGVYTVTVTLNRVFCGADTEIYQYIVVYDPSDGFVTGGGWIDSPEGAYVAEPSLTGTANFGFVAKYKKGKTVPEGNTEFQFQAAGLNFHSNSFDWLITAGPKAMFKGEGTINGEGLYGFQVSVIDAALTPSTEVDKFRIKIWDKESGMLVYDNMVGEDDPNAEPTTEITGGSITIHKSDLKSGDTENMLIDLASDNQFNYSLSNYPNPFSNSTIIEFTIPVETNVMLDVYNIFGQKVATLVNQKYIPGTYTVEFKAKDLPVGQYLYRLITAEYSKTQKMILNK